MITLFGSGCAALGCDDWSERNELTGTRRFSDIETHVTAAPTRQACPIGADRANTRSDFARLSASFLVPIFKVLNHVARLCIAIGLRRPDRFTVVAALHRPRIVLRKTHNDSGSLPNLASADLSTRSNKAHSHIWTRDGDAPEVSKPDAPPHAHASDTDGAADRANHDPNLAAGSTNASKPRLQPPSPL